MVSKGQGINVKIAIHDNDQTGYPNIALMKLSAFHKSKGDCVEWFDPIFNTYDKIYSSKIFTWTETDPYLPINSEFGGTGHSMNRHLPDYIEHACPDYNLYNCNSSYGFLTRGCPNKCPWCFVPEKEGTIRSHADIEEFLRHDSVVLMDNNVLAHAHGIRQIEKLARLGVKADFNQGLDARLIDDEIARRLSKIKWLAPLRLSCDQKGQIKAVQKAVTLLRWHNTTPRRYFVYVLVNDIEDALERIKFLKGMDLDPFVQPYRDPSGIEPGVELKQFARWVNHKAIFKSTLWENYIDGSSKSIKNIRGK